MKLWAAIFFAAVLCCRAAEWKTAQPGTSYEFPRDHFWHPEFKTEWWYFTGNLTDQAGHRFGYEITFFRDGIRPPNERQQQVSRFIVDDLQFAHFAITDANDARFLFREKTSRGAFGEAGFASGERVAWIQDWSVTLTPDGFQLVARTDEMSASFESRAEKQPVVEGPNGISIKASGEDHASNYYSITRLQTTGELRIGNATHRVSGESWFDHEWATNQLARDQVGWNWLSVQFSDGTDLMLYQMRLANSSIDPASSGSVIAVDGTPTYLKSDAYAMTPLRWWKSKTSGATYPVGWRVDVPQSELQFTVSPVLENQELALGALTYWEGAIDVSGTRAGKPIVGKGYLELTGYAGALKALTR